MSHDREGTAGSARVGRLQVSKTALACEHGNLHNGHTRLRILLRIFHHEAVAPSLSTARSPRTPTETLFDHVCWVWDCISGTAPPACPQPETVATTQAIQHIVSRHCAPTTSQQRLPQTHPGVFPYSALCASKDRLGGAAASSR
jgi:hypothetical protein